MLSIGTVSFPPKPICLIPESSCAAIQINHKCPISVLARSIKMTRSSVVMMEKREEELKAFNGHHGGAKMPPIVALMELPLAWWWAQACILQLFQAYHSESVCGQVYSIPLRAYQPCLVRNDSPSLTPRLTAPPQTDIPSATVII
ncbi:hypothetical protein NC652_013258 [Populus alba x Populus x berolinensis]|nr:hypothetical protein NC652_013258 [Populus alba x Populus x berolinensis]